MVDDLAAKKILPRCYILRNFTVLSIKIYERTILFKCLPFINAVSYALSYLIMGAKILTFEHLANGD